MGDVPIALGDQMLGGDEADLFIIHADERRAGKEAVDKDEGNAPLRQIAPHTVFVRIVSRSDDQTIQLFPMRV